MAFYVLKQTNEICRERASHQQVSKKEQWIINTNGHNTLKPGHRLLTPLISKISLKISPN